MSYPASPNYAGRILIVMTAVAVIAAFVCYQQGVDDGKAAHAKPCPAVTR